MKIEAYAFYLGVRVGHYAEVTMLNPKVGFPES